MATSRRRGTREQRREQLLDIAEALFIEHGYEAVHIDDVRRAAQLSKGGFYHHFKAKEALLHGLAEREVVRLIKMVEVVSEHEDPAFALSELFRLGSAFLDGDMSLVKALGAETSGKISSSRSLALTIFFEAIECELKSRIAPVLEKLIADGIRQRVFRSVDAAMTAELVLAVNTHVNRKVAYSEWSLSTAERFGANALDALAAHLGTTSIVCSARN